MDGRVHLSAAPMGVFRWPPPPVKCATERAGSHRHSIHYARGHRNRRLVRVTEGRRRIIIYINVFSERISALCFAAHFLIPAPRRRALCSSRHRTRAGHSHKYIGRATHRFNEHVNQGAAPATSGALLFSMLFVLAVLLLHALGRQHENERALRALILTYRSGRLRSLSAGEGLTIPDFLKFASTQKLQI